MQVKDRPVGSIKPYANNPRVNDPGVDAVAASLKEYGFRQPLVVNEDGVIIVGHTRYKAALKLGMKTVPVHVAVGLTPEQAQAYRIADNQTATLSAWDDVRLTAELAALSDAGFDLDLTGFSADDLERLLNPAGADGLTDPDAIPEPPDEAETQVGDVWILGDHRLLCGDSSKPEDVDRLLAGAAIHLVNTDPPYNVKVEPRSNNAIAAGLSSFVTYGNSDPGRDVVRHPEKSKATHKKLRAKDRPLANDFVTDEAFEALLLSWFGNIARVLQPGRAFYAWGGYSNVANYPPALAKCGLYFSQTIIWDKQHPVLTRKDYMGAHEWCQPPDTMVLTPSGTSRLGALRDQDRVVSFYPHSSAIVGLRDGLDVQVGQRFYTGDLYGVTVGTRQSWCTDGHIWTVRLSRDYPHKWCVYLMRRGPWWWVGITKMRTTWGFGLKGRLCSEHGDEGWVLSLHDSHAEARIHEQLVSVQFGIPQTCWQESKRDNQRTLAHIEALYAKLDLDLLDRAAGAVLAAYHRRREYPFVRNDETRAKFGARQSIQVRACNLLPDITEVPVPAGGQQAHWKSIRAIDVQPYDGMVHSLGVAKHQHYVADGLVTHNCFYGWREGAAHKYFGPNNATDLWQVKKVSPHAMVHLTEKPVELAQRAIEYSSRRGENVLDLFGGSGSTLIAAEQTGRNAYLMELDPLYCDVIKQRYEEFTGKTAERIPAGERLAMGTRGPAPTPTPILAIRGSWRAKARQGEPKPPRGKPTCPKSFTPAQKKVWKKLCKVLDQMKVLTHADGHQLERYCVFLERWRECEAFLARHGISYPIKSDDPTYYVARVPNTTTAVVGFAEHPQLKESHRLDAALKQIEQQFGLTPAARTRLHAEAPAPVSSLAEFARKRFFND